MTPTLTREVQARAAVDVHPGLGHYLRTVTRDRLLKPEQESDLGKRIGAAQAAAERLESDEPLLPEAKARLRRIEREGDVARRQLLRHNMRLAIKMARTFHAAAPSLDEEYTLDDRIQDATIGLMRAVDLFDPAKGYRFTTYASWWIRQSLQRGSQVLGVTRLPAHVWERLSKLWKARFALREAGGVLNVRSLSMVSGLSEQHVQDAMEVEPRLLSTRLDAPLTEDGLTLGEVLPDPASRPDQEATRAATARRLRSHLTSQLTERELFVMERRFGLLDDREWTLEEVGEALGLTRERVRQIQAKVLKRLRDDETVRALL